MELYKKHRQKIFLSESQKEDLAKVYNDKRIVSFDTDKDYCYLWITDASLANDMPKVMFFLPTKIYLDNTWTYRDGLECICLKTNKMSIVDKFKLQYEEKYKPWLKEILDDFFS